MLFSDRSLGQKSTLQTLVDGTLSTRVVTEVDRVQEMPVSFGDPGLILYEAEDIPQDRAWCSPANLAPIPCAAQPSA